MSNAGFARVSSPGPAKTPLLGTFLGVFTPSVLTILGVVLFLRSGWVVGNVGLVPAMGIVLLAHVITFATALSVSAVATNMRVGAGGAYFMISRSLGLEIGGAIGVPLFLAQTFSLTLYAFGFAEGLQLFWPDVPMRPVAALTIVAVSIVAGKSTQLALKLQIPIMLAIVAAVISLFAGALESRPESLVLWGGAADGLGFWAVFAVFFPAVTGLMAGVSMSGDLKDPTKSIPRGTLVAVAVGFVVYLTVPIFLAGSSSAEQLASNNLIWFDIAAIPLLIYPGLFGAIISSALGSMLGAPRTLDALIGDRVVPGLPRWLTGSSSSGLVSHVVATLVALSAVLLGDLNAVAPVLTMFFLTTYGVVNLVAGIEQLIGSPSYRPAIRVPWYVSIVGAVGCLWVMVLISPLAAFIALVVEFALYVGLRRRSLAAAWGDMRYGATMSLVRSLLLRLRTLPVDPRNWRPNILVFAGAVENRLDLVRFAAWLNQGRGILTVSKVLVGDFEELSPKVPAELEEMNRLLEREQLIAFAEIDVADELESGVLQVVQANGIAGLTSNTIMLGWSDRQERLAAQLRIARRAAALERSTIICRLAPRDWSDDSRNIDVWWGGLQNNGDMLLLFAYLISANPSWRGAKIRVKAIATSAMSQEQVERSLGQLLARTRIDAVPVVFGRPDGESVQDVIQRESQDADIVFLGLQTPANGEEASQAERLAALVDPLPTAIMVHAAGPFAGQLLESSSDG